MINTVFEQDMKVINDISVKGIDNGQDNQSEHIIPNINPKILKVEA